MFTGIPNIDAAWPTVEPLIRKALDKAGDRRFSPLSIKKALKRREMQLWGDDGLIVITEVRQYPRIKVFLIFLVSGKMDIDAEPVLETYARASGCREITAESIHSEAAWRRKYGLEDYEVTRTVWRKKLD